MSSDGIEIQFGVCSIQTLSACFLANNIADKRKELHIYLRKYDLNRCLRSWGFRSTSAILSSRTTCWYDLWILLLIFQAGNLLIDYQELIQRTSEQYDEARIVVVASHAHAMYKPAQPDKIDFEGLRTEGSKTIQTLAEVQASLQRSVLAP